MFGSSSKSFEIFKFTCIPRLGRVRGTQHLPKVHPQTREKVEAS